MLLLNWLTRFQKLLRSANRRRSLRRRERPWPINAHIELLEARTVLDGQPVVSIANASTPENNGMMAFPVFVDWSGVAPGTFNGNVTVAYATSAGSATSGADFSAALGTLTFMPGESVKSLSV